MTDTVDENVERLQLELELVSSIYPEEVSYSEHRRELVYAVSASALSLRLPSGYPTKEKPEILSASVTPKAGRQTDLRDKVRKVVDDFQGAEEALDAIIAAFVELVEQHQVNERQCPEVSATAGAPDEHYQPTAQKKTVVIWLHHLLNTAKRKQALAPSDPSLSGISKPGYPGVFIFSGPKSNVEQHVNELKRQNWQAFQARLEEDEQWTFEHGLGIIEVEEMKDVVREVGLQKKDAFMEAMKIK